MKKILIICFSLVFITPIFSQKRDITLDDLWKNYAFYPKSMGGFNSMNDGEHYSTIEKTEDGQEIIKYQFKNGKKVRIPYLKVLILKFQKLGSTHLVKMKSNFY